MLIFSHYTPRLKETDTVNLGFPSPFSWGWGYILVNYIRPGPRAEAWKLVFISLAHQATDGTPSILIGLQAADPIDHAPHQMPPKVWLGSLAAPGRSWHRTPLCPECQAQALKFLWVCLRLLSAASSHGSSLFPKAYAWEGSGAPLPLGFPKLLEDPQPTPTPIPPLLSLASPSTAAHPAGLEESLSSRDCISPDIWGMSQSSPCPSGFLRFWKAKPGRHLTQDLRVFLLHVPSPDMDPDQSIASKGKYQEKKEKKK